MKGRAWRKGHRAKGLGSKGQRHKSAKSIELRTQGSKVHPE